MPFIKLVTFIASYYLLYKNTQFNKIFHVICKLELYKCEFSHILRTVLKTSFFKGKTKEKGENILQFQLSKNSTCTFLLERKSPDYAKGSRCNLVSCAAQTPACCVNMIAFLWLSTQLYINISNNLDFFFSPANCYYLFKYVRAAAVLLRVFALFLICLQGKSTVKRLGVKWAWSDRRRAVADLRGEFVGRLVRLRLLQHVVLHDGLLVSVDGGVRVIGVVPGLVPAGLIGRLRGHRLFALTAQEVAADTTQEVVFPRVGKPATLPY